MCGSADVFIVFSPKVLCNQDSGSGGESHEESDHQVCDRRKCAYGRKGVFPDVVSHNPGIYCVVKLLKQVSDQKWKRETDEHREDGSLCHIYLRLLFET